MKKIIAALMTLILLCTAFTINATENTVYDSYIEHLVTENETELSSIVNLLKENESGCGAVPDDPADVHAEDLVRLYTFDDPHILNVYNETGTLTNNFDDEYNYKYFSETEESTIELSKNENGEWDIAIYDMEVKARKDRFPGQPSTFKEMIADVIEQHPNLDFTSVKYINYSVLGTYLIYFSDSDTEYLVTYPLDDLQTEFEYGKIFTLSEFIDTVDEFPVFNRTEPVEGYGGADIGTINKKSDTPWYVYPAIGISVVLIVGAVGYVIIKRKRTEQ